jgi:hypothetical protein
MKLYYLNKYNVLVDTRAFTEEKKEKERKKKKRHCLWPLGIKIPIYCLGNLKTGEKFDPIILELRGPYKPSDSF